MSETVRAGCCGNIPDDVCPNATDPANTASNGPAVPYPRDAKVVPGGSAVLHALAPPCPPPYDLVILSSFGGPEGQEDVIPFLRNVTAGRGILMNVWRKSLPITAQTVVSRPLTSRTVHFW